MPTYLAGDKGLSRFDGGSETWNEQVQYRSYTSVAAYCEAGFLYLGGGSRDNFNFIVHKVNPQDGVEVLGGTYPQRWPASPREQDPNPVYDDIDGIAVLSSGLIGVAGSTQLMSALNPDGSIAWIYDFADNPDSGIIGPPKHLMTDGTHFYVTTTRSLVKLDASGTTVWENNSFSSLVSQEGEVYQGYAYVIDNSTRIISKVDTSNGSVAASYTFSGTQQAGRPYMLTLGGGHVFVMVAASTSSDPKIMHKLDLDLIPAGGAFPQSFTHPSGLAFDSGKLIVRRYLTFGGQHVIGAHDPADLSTLWQENVGGIGYKILAKNGTVYYTEWYDAGTPNKLFARSSSDGSLLYAVDLYDADENYEVQAIGLG